MNAIAKRTADNIYILSIFLILCSLWIIVHPYRGVDQDASLYAIQALGQIYPEIFHDDLFLKFTSQENFTFFTKIYVFVIHQIGFSAANIVIFILGQLSWFIAAFLVTGLFYRGSSKYLAFAFAVVMPRYYSSQMIFSFAETFLTPRLFAESLILLSIFFGVQNKYLLSVLFLLSALLIHPIIAATALLFFSVYFFLKNGKVMILVGMVLLTIAMLMALLKVPPFDGIFKIMDGEWTHVVQKQTGFLFIGNWSTRDLLPIITSFISVTTYCLLTGKKRRLLFISVGFATLIAFFLSITFGDLVNNVLILQMQLWRTSWLLLFFGYLCFLSIYVNIRKRFHFKKSFLIACCVCWLIPYRSIFIMIYPLILLVAFLSFLTKNCRKFEQPLCSFLNWKKYQVVGESLDNFLFLLCIMLIAADHFVFLYLLSELQKSTPYLKMPPFDHSFYHCFLITILSLIFLLRQIRTKDHRFILISFGLLFYSLAVWDQRLSLERLIGEKFGIEPVWMKSIPLSAEVFWPGFPEASWFLAKRKNYVSALQSSGVVFSRDTALLFKKRMKSTEILYDLENPLKFYNCKNAEQIDEQFRQGLKKSCSDSSDLDYIILPRAMAEYQPQKFELFMPFQTHMNFMNLDYQNQDWYIYACGNVRSVP